jgi:hypothetical protein
VINLEEYLQLLEQNFVTDEDLEALEEADEFLLEDFDFDSQLNNMFVF